MDREQVKTGVSLSGAQAVVQYLRVLAEMLERRLLAPEEDPWDEVLSLRGENERLVREQAQAKNLIRQLHEQLRQTQDELADLTVKYRKLCAEIPPVGTVRRDAEKATALEAAQDFEDGAVPGPPHRTCETCFRNVQSHCRSRQSRWADLLVGPAQPACGEYVGLPTPGAGSGPKPVSPPPAPPAVTVIRKGPCPSCGHTVCFNQGGTPYKHDINGKVYRGHPGRVADKARPCPGKAVQA